MIRCIFKKTNENWISFTITGHAGFGEYGEDIVCAGVSALAISTCNSIEAIVGYTPIVETDHQNGGYLYFEALANLTTQQQFLTNVLLEHLYLGLASIEQEYSYYITIEMNEKHTKEVH